VAHALLPGNVAVAFRPPLARLRRAQSAIADIDHSFLTQADDSGVAWERIQSEPESVDNPEVLGQAAVFE
jgi:hypothetical protein